MAEYTKSPFLKEKAYKPAPEGFAGQAAGGCGTYGLLNDGADHRQPINEKGTFGPSAGVAPSGYARQLISKSTGVSVNDGKNPPIYGKPGSY